MSIRQWGAMWVLVAATGCGSMTVVAAPAGARPAAVVGRRLLLAPLGDLEGRGAQDVARVRAAHGCLTAALAAGYKVVARDPLAAPAPAAEGDWGSRRKRALAEAADAGADTVIHGRLLASGEGGFGNRARGIGTVETVTQLELQWLAVSSGALLAEEKLETVDGYEPQGAGRRACAALLAAAGP